MRLLTETAQRLLRDCLRLLRDCHFNSMVCSLRLLRDCSVPTLSAALIDDPHEVCSLLLSHVDTFNVIKWWSRSGITIRVITTVTGRKNITRMLFDTKQDARNMYWVYGDQL